MDRSDNPAFSKGVIDRVKELDSAQSATIGGTTVKTLLLLIITFVSAYFGWQAAAAASATLFIGLVGGSIIALIAALIAAFKPQTAFITGPIYALAQGFVVGVISQTYNVQFDGIVLQAIGLTGAIFFVALWFFQAGLIKVTDKFRIGVIIATLGIGLFYLVSWIISLFGGPVPTIIAGGGTFGIIFSLIVVFVATLNLFLDFDLVQRTVRGGAPKAFEWFSAFALIVTIIWLYIEILRLLGKVRGN